MRGSSIAHTPEGGGFAAATPSVAEEPLERLRRVWELSDAARRAHVKT